MSVRVAAEVLGGVVMFLVGMQELSGALRTLAGDRLRRWLTAATASSTRGLALGTSVGFLAHSSAASVMTVGFINAGLLSLTAALPVLFGANVGTTLSMQVISFRLSDYALAAVAIGGVLQLAVSEGRWRTTGRALLGFGFLFLGMKISGDAIVPYRDTLAPWLARVDGSTLLGLVAGVGVAALVTGIVQSSGAVIGMTFVLAGSGAFTSLSQTYPIVLGAHIGTSVTGLLASIGTSVEARRAAIGNLFFNIFNATGGVLAAGLLIPLIERTSPDLVHQTANTHTAIMTLAAVILLPLTRVYAAVLRRFIGARAPQPEASFLEPHLLRTPEDALVATLRELGRCARLCVDSFKIVSSMLESADRRSLRQVRHNEDAVDEIRASLRAWLATLSRAQLSRRQALLVQALDRCIVELERVGDHIERLGCLVGRDQMGGLARLDERTVAGVRMMVARAAGVVDALAASFAAVDEATGFDGASWAVLETRNTYQRDSLPVRADLTERLSRHEIPAEHVLVFSEFSAALDRIVRHSAVIAQEQRQPTFAVKPSKLGRLAGPHGAPVET